MVNELSEFAPDHKSQARFIKGRWGNPQTMPQKGVISYSLASNRQNLFAGVARAAISNTWRRSKNQVWYWAPTFAAFYFVFDWADKRNEYLNSKAGRMDAAGE